MADRTTGPTHMESPDDHRATLNRSPPPDRRGSAAEIDDDRQAVHCPPSTTASFATLVSEVGCEVGFGDELSRRFSMEFEIASQQQIAGGLSMSHQPGDEVATTPTRRGFVEAAFMLHDQPPQPFTFVDSRDDSNYPLPTQYCASPSAAEDSAETGSLDAPSQEHIGLSEEDTRGREVIDLNVDYFSAAGATDVRSQHWARGPTWFPAANPEDVGRGDDVTRSSHCSIEGVMSRQGAGRTIATANMASTAWQSEAIAAADSYSIISNMPGSGSTRDMTDINDSRRHNRESGGQEAIVSMEKRLMDVICQQNEELQQRAVQSNQRVVEQNSERMQCYTEEITTYLSKQQQATVVKDTRFLARLAEQERLNAQMREALNVQIHLSTQNQEEAIRRMMVQLSAQLNENQEASRKARAELSVRLDAQQHHSALARKEDEEMITRVMAQNNSQQAEYAARTAELSTRLEKQQQLLILDIQKQLKEQAQQSAHMMDDVSRRLLGHLSTQLGAQQQQLTEHARVYKQLIADVRQHAEETSRQSAAGTEVASSAPISIPELRSIIPMSNSAGYITLSPSSTSNAKSATMSDPRLTPSSPIGMRWSAESTARDLLPGNERVNQPTAGRILAAPVSVATLPMTAGSAAHNTANVANVGVNINAAGNLTAATAQQEEIAALRDEVSELRHRLSQISAPATNIIIDGTTTTGAAGGDGPTNRSDANGGGGQKTENPGVTDRHPSTNLALPTPSYHLAAAAQHKGTVMRPKEYDGKESVNSFLSHFDVCAEFNKWTADEKGAWLQWALKDRARQVLWDGPAGTARTFSDLATALRQRFGSDHQQEIHKIELENRRRRQNESLSELMQDVRRLMVLGYPTEQGSMWESVATTAFLNALNDPHLALEIRKRSPTSLDAAYKDAILLDGYYKASRSDRSGDRLKPNQARSARTGDADEPGRQDREWHREFLQTVQKGNQQTMQQILQQQDRHAQQQAELLKSLLGTPRPNGPSVSVQNVGPARQPLAANNRTDEAPCEQHYDGQGRGRGGGIICFRCHRPGHVVRHCPEVGPSGRGQASSSAPIQDGNPPAVNRRLIAARSVYFPAKISGRSCWCLLDSRSVVSSIPAQCLTNQPIYPNAHPIRPRALPARYRDANFVGIDYVVQPQMFRCQICGDRKETRVALRRHKKAKHPFAAESDVQLE